jgi:hypothetical protein
VNKLNIAIALTVAGLLMGCTDSGSTTNPARTAEQAIGRAEAKFEQSRAVGHAWLPAKQSLAAAKEAYENADYPAAIAEAERADALAEASLAQAEAEQDAWHERFPTVI